MSMINSKEPFIYNIKMDLIIQIYFIFLLKYMKRVGIKKNLSYAVQLQAILRLTS